MFAIRFDVRSDERRDVLLASGTLFGLMSAHALLETARDALFLGSVSATRLPWVYLAIAVFALVVTGLQQRRQGSVDPRHAFIATIAAWAPDDALTNAVLVDVFCHPRFWNDAARLLDALDLGDDLSCIAYSEVGTPEKNSALAGAGFTEAAAKPEHRVEVEALAAGVPVQRWERASTT